jgi:hypothetical protein
MKIDEEFFAAGKPCFGCDQEFLPEGHVKSNFLCNLAYGDPSALFPRLPRLPFDEACRSCTHRVSDGAIAVSSKRAFIRLSTAVTTRRTNVVVAWHR